MGFTLKSDKPYPPVPTGKTKEWANKYFNWEQGEGENFSKALKPLVEQYGKGHPDWIEKIPEPKAVVSKVSDTITIPVGQLANIIDDAVNKKMESMKTGSSGDDTKQLLSDLVDRLDPTPGMRYRAVSEVQVDKDDYLDEPVMFFCYLNKFAIYSERRYGQEVKTPYGRPITFSNISGHVTGNPKGGKQTVQVSAAQIQTKKELQWLRSSPMFNVTFFEKVVDAEMIDPHRASQLARALTEISAMSEYQVMQAALSQGIKPGTDIEVMRRQLINLKAQQNMEGEKAISRNAASATDASIEATIRRGIDKNQISGVMASSY